MKQTLWIAAAGALLLAGCKSNDVMGERNYFGPKPESVTQLPPPKAERQPAAQPQVPQYEPMTGVVSSQGVDSVTGAIPGKASTYTVRKGDTLGKIAAAHGVKLGALMTINNLDAQKAKRLKIGQKLTIPAGGVAVKSAKEQAKAAGKSAATGKLNKDGFYVIQSGDSFGKIASRFKVKVSDILKANNMTEADARRLQIGQKIVIPGKSPAAATPAAKNPETTDPEGTTPEGNVAVEEGQPKVVVPPPPPVGGSTPVIDLSKTTIVEVTEESISLEDFARKHNTNADTLRQLNQGCAQMLQKGDPIIIPTGE